MIRLILRLFGIRDFEVCASCETLKQQLDYERAEKAQLTETLLRIVSPKAIEHPIVEVNPVIQSSGLFSRRRAALEERERQEAKILREQKHLGRPDNLRDDVLKNIAKDVTELEKELGVEQKEA